MTETYYPPVKFHFTASVLSSDSSAGTTLSGIDASFQEVSGIEAEFGIEEVVEGGENRFVHRLPKQTKTPPLVLKRGVVTRTSALGDWVAATLGSTLSTPILPKTLLIQLLDENANPVITWGFSNAYPLKWKTSSLNSKESDILTESLEFSYNVCTRSIP